MTETEMQRQEAVVETMLFTMGKSVETSLLAAALECATAEAEATVERLAAWHAEASRGVQLLRLESVWRLGTRREFYDALIRVAKEPRWQVLNQVVLETLTIITYRQPVTKMEVAKIRGVSSDRAVNKLIEYGLTYGAGRLGVPGCPALFATTKEFLQRFGMDFGQDLPSATPDQEAEIREEVKRELNYRFETEEGELGEDSEGGD